MAENAPAAAAAAAAAPASPTAANASGPSNSSSNVKISDTVSSLADLQQKAPQVYNMMLQGIAMNIVNEMQQQQQELKELQDKEYHNQ